MKRKKQRGLPPTIVRELNASPSGVPSQKYPISALILPPSRRDEVLSPEELEKYMLRRGRKKLKKQNKKAAKAAIANAQRVKSERKKYKRKVKA